MKGHAPQYPKYTSPSPERVLAYWTPATGIVDEDNNRLAMPSDLSTLRDILWTNNYLLFVDSIPAFPLLPEIIYNYPHAEVLGTDKGEALAIKLIGTRNTTRWIVSSTCWGFPASDSLLRVLRCLYDYCGVGCSSTPGALGQAIMRTTWGEHKLKWHTRPRTALADLIKRYGFGGRVDTPGHGKRYERLLELDEKGAYIAKEHFGKVPTGTTDRIINRSYEQATLGYDRGASFFTWFGECDAYIRQPLRLGPFGVRERHSQITYPTQPGCYRTYLWREQADDLRLLGGDVHILQGWGWGERAEWTEDTQHYCAVMAGLRDNAPTKEIADLVKSATVAGIGRHAMGRTMKLLVPPEQAAPGDVSVGGVLNGQGIGYDWYVHDFPDPYQTNMIHWNNYCVMQCNRTLFWEAYKYAERGWLAATNYDAIYLHLWDYDVWKYPEKGSQEDHDSPCGTWRRRLLLPKDEKTPMIPAPRSLDAVDEFGNRVRKRPGVQEE